MDSKKIAFDLDGTLVNTPFAFHIQENRGLLGQFLTFCTASLACLLAYPKTIGLDKSRVGTVITGRSDIYGSLTWLQLRLFGFKNVKKVVMNPHLDYTAKHVLQFKCDALKQHGIDVYVDDCGETRRILSGLYSSVEYIPLSELLPE